MKRTFLIVSISGSLVSATTLTTLFVVWVVTRNTAWTWQSGAAVALIGTLWLHDVVSRWVDVHVYRLRVGIGDLYRRKRLAEDGQAQPPQFHRRTLGQYHIERLLARGGMGEVYRARHQIDGTLVALKVLPLWLARKPHARARFEREVATAAGLHHPNIIPLMDYGMYRTADDHDGLYLAMPLIEGRELGDLLRQREHLDEAETVHIISAVAAALDYLHAQGIVHRDVKPRNIMLTHANGQPLHTVDGETQVLLMDFGIARPQTLQPQTVSFESVIGTLDYASPEQMSRHLPINARADVYALGVTAFHLLTGRLPFHGGISDVIFGHLHTPAPDPRQYRPALTPSISAVLAQALHKDPAARYASAGEFAAALARAVSAPSAYLPTRVRAQVQPS
jgi:serine/threonine protein kinase